MLLATTNLPAGDTLDIIEVMVGLLGGIALFLYGLHRMSEAFGDDTITILLDPHNVGRSGYFFDLNANGVRNEGLYANVTEENWQ